MRRVGRKQTKARWFSRALSAYTRQFRYAINTFMKFSKKAASWFMSVALTVIAGLVMVHSPEALAARAHHPKRSVLKVRPRPKHASAKRLRLAPEYHLSSRVNPVLRQQSAVSPNSRTL